MGGGKLYATLNIVINLLILGVFKYYNFFISNFSELCSQIGLQANVTSLNIILPVGVSFYTFQALSYTIDVYKKKIVPTHDLIEFSAYISFFPQLVAGPIERATNLLPQFQTLRTFDYSKAVDGMRQMLWGFFKKIVIADNCASVVNAYWGEYDSLTGVSLFVLGVLFTFQIYCDFSGYSDIAIGCARLFGFNLMRNFNFPYFSRSIPEFWRRWHISLTTWFRDYIYFPLGGSRCSKWKIIRNVYIVWGVSGLWHGANWTFVFWGLYHATLLAIYNMLGINTKYKNYVAFGKYFPNIKEFFQMTLTFTLAVIGWIIFRAESLTQAYHYIARMLTTILLDPGIHHGRLFLITGIVLMVIEWMQRGKQHALQFSEKGLFKYRAARWGVYYIILVIIAQYMANDQTFIYFQF